MSIAVRPGARFQTGPPVRLFPTDIAAGSKDSLEFFGYSPAADGRHFLIRTAIAERPPPVTVIVNWSLPGGLGQEDSGTDPSLSQHP